MTYALITLLCVYLLWVHYVAVMRLMQVRDAGQLTPAMKAIGYPALVVGLLLDLIVNTVVATALFLELPREWTVSGRLWRLSNSPSSWRQRTALWLRVNLLDPIDPSGTHKG